MLTSFPSRPSRLDCGFTLIELMVAVAIFGLLAALAGPSYSQWISNTRVRTTAEALQNGLMLAKAEAVRRNTKVQFVITTSDPTSANTGSVAASTAGKSWMVRIYQSSGTYTSADFIQGRSSAEGSTNVTVDADQSTVVFNGVGQLSPIPASTINIDVTGTGASRPLRVALASGGAIRMCDPATNVANTVTGC